MPIFKQVGEAALYFGVGNILVPFSTDFETYQIHFKNNLIIELSSKEFMKFTVATAVKVVKVEAEVEPTEPEATPV